MRIAIDLQACQSPGSRRRGIGRYSLELASALVRNRGTHRIHFLLNAAFDELDAFLRDVLTAHGPATFEHYHLIHLEGTQGRRRQAIQRINDEILNWRYACANADALHVSSVFEGWYGGEEHVTSRVADVPGAVKSATLYDLIPLLFPDKHLPRALRSDYLSRLGIFQQFDLIFAISESARADAMRLLDIPPERIVNIRAAAAQAFRKLPALPPGEIAATRARYALSAGRLVLYSGGNDPRKNVDFLLRAFAALPPEIGSDCQLALVGALERDERRTLEKRLSDLGISERVVLTGYIADAELNLLYNLCDLFVFPSLYEGFGLPVLEAMTCGACVIASGTSSMPEIVGRNDALFEPTDLTGLTRLMKELLAEPERRRELAAFNLARSREFSWDRVAQTMLAAIEETQRRQACALFGTERPKRPRVALFAPLPPQPTPIADYTAAMLPHWARYFDLELIADNYTPDLDSIHGRYPVVDVRELRRDPSRYDCVLYLLANSEFHAEMYELLPEIPGVVLMFDAVLSRLVDWLESTGRQPGILMRALSSEGERALLDLEAAERGDLSVEALVARHPMSRRVLLHACGMILQWQHARRLLCRAYPDLADVPYRVVPPPSFHKAGEDRATARAALGLDAEDVLIASFGVLDETRLNDVLLAAVARDDFVQDPRIRVAFVGELPQGPYRTRIVDVLGQHPMRDRIAITGGVEKFVHERYRVACDIAVQLEALTDASSLAVTHELLATGCATVVSGETIRGEWPDHVVRKLDAIDAATLATALFALIVDRSTRNSLAASARRWIAGVCHPALVAARHASAVTLLPELDRARCAASLVRRIAECVANDELESEVSVAASDAIAPGIALHPTTARRLPRQRDSLEPSRTSGKRQA